MSDNTDELQKKLEQALASIEKLETKNKEILEENKKRKAEADAAKELADEAAAERERESKDVAAVEKRLADKHARELSKLQEQLQARDNQLSTLLVDNTIATALTKHNVAPQFAKAVTAMLKAEAKLENGEVLVNGTPFSDHIEAFMSGDEGKAFISAPANGGASAMGSKTAGTALPDTWNLTQYVQMKNSSPEDAAKYAAKHNKTF